MELKASYIYFWLDTHPWNCSTYRDADRQTDRQEGNEDNDKTRQKIDRKTDKK